MKHLVLPDSGPRHRAMKPFAATKTFAKFVLLSSGLMLLAGGCNDGGWKRALRDWLPGLVQDSVSLRKQDQALLEREQIRDDNLQRKLIGDRLRTRHAIEIRLAYAIRFQLSYGLTPDSAAQYVNALVVHGSISQVSGEYDTVVIKFLGGCAGVLERQPATEAVEQLIAIIGICGKNSVSARLAKAALRDALGNRAIEPITKGKIGMVLAGESVIPLRIVEMPPCCVSPQEAGQTPPDSLALRMMTER